MARLRNYRHELFAQALADGKSRGDAMVAAGYNWHRGNQNRLAQSRDIVARVEELRKVSGGFNRSSQHPVYRSLVAIGREFPLVFSSRVFSWAWY